MLNQASRPGLSLLSANLKLSARFFVLCPTNVPKHEEESKIHGVGMARRMIN